MNISSPIKTAFKLLALAGLHSSLCGLVSQLILNRSPEQLTAAIPGLEGSGLVLLAKILFAPLISWGWYPRFLFPGDWIWFPIFANSLVWALAILSGVRLVGRFRRRRVFPDSGMDRP